MSMRSIYRKIAKKHSISVAEVKRDMQAAIDYAYKKTDKSDNEQMMQESFSYKGEVPTAEEFIKAVADKIKNSELE
ncbi:sporulation initiation factor Spo0A-like protein [Hydrogenoanaerobacterium saccharovorans]|uniref:Sporulation initiation factor Spo0A C terminal n=1 Tax=Hydrogenoanaerobacterium saccharovorans TaxID=474960 RepID=A0A1H8ARC9_9FIRM|nr:sporulation initiation factor Spo0A C-terminal domain-containing protein [Hydrogenoanaerobacterium saccharovorans]RPF47824.1 sporulation initiation factor Spo0A-like protein [Hydrogenoanaerobacterium saccharovorans]SEM72524.1 Sporulation initiation factor Spo0A C terminal [Hydrogenoanaerobacterium saccharovorans]